MIKRELRARAGPSSDLRWWSSPLNRLAHQASICL